MGYLEHMMAGAEKTTGDTILAAAVFVPKGATGHEMGGMVAGFAVGSLLPGGQEYNISAVAQNIGRAKASGPEGPGDLGNIAVQGGAPLVVAMNDTKIYVLRSTAVRGIHREKLELLHTFERHHVHVTAQAKALARTLVIEDPRTGERVELESQRGSWKSQGKDIVAALVADSFEDDEVAEQDNEQARQVDADL